MTPILFKRAQPEMNHRDMYGDASRTVIDVAIGVLVGHRRCSERQAFNEIAAVVSETGVGLGSACRPLVELASGTTDSFDNRSEFVGLWGDLLAGPATQLLGVDSGQRDG